MARHNVLGFGITSGVSVFLLLVLAMCGAAPAAQAQAPWWQPSEIRIGAAAHDVKPISSGTEPGAALNGELFFQPILRSGDGMLTLKPSIGGSASLSGDTSYGFVDLTAQIRLPDPFFFDLGGGLAVHDGYDHAAPLTRKDLGSRVLFHVSADLGARLTNHLGLSIYIDHLSNAGLAHTNQGLETFGLRVAWLF